LGEHKIKAVNSAKLHPLAIFPTTETTP